MIPRCEICWLEGHSKSDYTCTCANCGSKLHFNFTREQQVVKFVVVDDVRCPQCDIAFYRREYLASV